MKYKKIAQEIIQMALLDQKVREAYEKNPAYLNKMRETDILNLRKMKKIIKQIGWPTIGKVGKKASHMAWLLVQHADSDLKFQEYCLRLMKNSLKDNEVPKADVAFLTDRVLANKGMEQIYGTQFYEDKGKLIPRAIKNPNELNTRRKRMGLKSFKDYEKKLIKQMQKRLRLVRVT